MDAAHRGVQRRRALDRGRPSNRLGIPAFGCGSAALGPLSTAGVSSSGSRRDLDIGGAAGGGLAIEEPGVGDGAAAGGGNAAGVAAMLAGGGGPFPWTGEQAVPAGAAFLGAGAVGAQDRRFGLSGL